MQQRPNVSCYLNVSSYLIVSQPIELGEYSEDCTLQRIWPPNPVISWRTIPFGQLSEYSMASRFLELPSDVGSVRQSFR
jgi:hypothetical protein